MRRLIQSVNNTLSVKVFLIQLIQHQFYFSFDSVELNSLLSSEDMRLWILRAITFFTVLSGTCAR